MFSREVIRYYLKEFETTKYIRIKIYTIDIFMALRPL